MMIKTLTYWCLCGFADYM